MGKPLTREQIENVDMAERYISAAMFLTNI